ncbi:MAG: ATP-binding protein [Bacteroidota bacterium]|nr:ATP-binding protein [Bacteroidota bacterium]
METLSAEQQKTFNAEKQISYARAVVIIFGTFSFFFLNEQYLKKELSYGLLGLIWIYGTYVLWFKPYEKYPIFLASWFTYISDCVFATLWIYATGGFYSPFHVILYTSIIAVAFRFDLKTTMFTAALYTVSYFLLLYFMDQLDNNFGMTLVRTGFFFIIGFMTVLITRETLEQTRQKINMQALAKEAQDAHRLLADSQHQLSLLNQILELRNSIFTHAEQNAMIGSYSWNLNTNTLDYSDNLFRLLDHEPGDFQPSFEKYLSFLHPEDQEAMIESGKNAEMIDFKPKTEIHRVIKPNGQIKYLRATGQIIEEGNERKMIGTLQDITSDIKLQEQLKLKNMELEQINNQLASFNYFASHDLQEPVRKIQTFSQLILEKDDQIMETSRGYLDRISSSSRRMQNLIQAFLNYSKIGNAVMILEKTNLNDLVKDVISNLQELIEEKDARIEVENLSSLPVAPVQFHQLFMNLLSNAIKYGPSDKSPEIHIRSESVEGRRLNFKLANKNILYRKITVEDNGIGFDEQYSDKIFEVFQRLHSKDKYGGSGIGLAICKRVVESHKGFIGVTSEPGKGSKFSIYIPET